MAFFIQADLFECPVTRTEANEKQRIPIALKQEAKGAGHLILWLDCDKEGENICFEITGILDEFMQLVPGRVSNWRVGIFEQYHRRKESLEFIVVIN